VDEPKVDEAPHTVRDDGAPDVRLVATGAGAPGDAEALRCFREALLAGCPWFPALLEAIGRWTSPRETVDGQNLNYLIDGEAFDWLALAERLIDTTPDLIPEVERDALLFSGIIPEDLDAGEVRRLIGERKFGQYLNYFYGVTVEEGLLLAVQEEIEKEKRARGLRRTDASEDAYLRIYEANRADLFRDFRKEKRYPQLKSTTLTEQKEFTYWLFKHRFKHGEKARIASDTRKSLTYLKRQWDLRGGQRVLAVSLDFAESG
jgi:hypothetical protein